MTLLLVSSPMASVATLTVLIQPLTGDFISLEVPYGSSLSTVSAVLSAAFPELYPLRRFRLFFCEEESTSSCRIITSDTVLGVVHVIEPRIFIDMTPTPYTHSTLPVAMSRFIQRSEPLVRFHFQLHQTDTYAHVFLSECLLLMQITHDPIPRFTENDRWSYVVYPLTSIYSQEAFDDLIFMDKHIREGVRLMGLTPKKLSYPEEHCDCGAAVSWDKMASHLALESHRPEEVDVEEKENHPPVLCHRTLPIAVSFSIQCECEEVVLSNAYERHLKTRRHIAYS